MRAHRSSVFCTLTYSPEKLPFVSLDNPSSTLVPKDLQLFLKRLRKAYPQPLRFFAVGEYGDRTWRPHYHAALFGFPNCARGNTAQSLSSRYLWRECCSVCRLVGEAWNAGQQGGDIGLRAMDRNAARYLGGYVTKKLTKKEDPRLDGRFPEFSRQSRRPGVGAPLVADMARSFSRYLDASEVDVCGYLTGEGGKKRPLGRFLRNKFREAVGTTEEVKDNASYQAWLEQMLPLLEAAKTDVEAPTLRAQVIKNSLASSESLRFQEELYRQKNRGRKL